VELECGVRNMGQWLDEFSPFAEMVRAHAQERPAPGAGEFGSDAAFGDKNLEQLEGSLVHAYLVANLGAENLPLKSFLDEFEKSILIACLRLTHGNQRRAAAVLRVKPTALFEKMRKHGIRIRKERLPGSSQVSVSGESA
jgi:DNA-binding NtrC family response regulator